MPITLTTTLAGASTAPTTLQSSATFDGVTYTFNKDMPVGTFVTGESFVVSDSEFTITSISPASADINDDGSFGHGAMKDPFIRSSTTNVDYTTAGGAIEQGFDDYLVGLTTSATPYNSALNVDPGSTGSAISIALGENTSIVKSVRKSTTISNGSWDTFEKYVALTILSEAPPANCFRPTTTGTTKRLYTTADLDLSVFRSLTLPASFTDTLSEIEALMPSDPGNFGANGSKLRRFRLDANLGTTTSNYSADLTSIYGKALVLLHSNAYTNAEKQALLHKLVTWGIQLEGMYDRGWRGLGRLKDGAGQHGLFINNMYLTAFALNSATILAKAQNLNSPTKNSLWVTEDRLNIVPGESSGNTAQPFIADDLGVPHISVTPDIGSNFATRYGTIASVILAWEGASIALLQNGPDGVNGFAAVTNGASDTTNDRAALWAYLDRYKTIVPNPGSSWNVGTAWRDLWTQIQGLGVYTPWTGVPEQLHTAIGFLEGENGDRFTATADGYSWDVSDHDYATETVTSVDFRHSLDGVQYVENIGAGATGSITGLLRGVTHYIGLRFVSASGAGPWSQNWPLTETVLRFDAQTGAFAEGEIVTGATSGATGKIIRVFMEGATWGRLRLMNTVGTFLDNEAISGSILGAATAAKAAAAGWAETNRNAFPTTGTPTATIPEFTTNPVIHYKRSPQWDWDSGNWLPASGTLTTNAVELACGLGYVSGQATPSFAFQWKRDGVDIAGATSQTYTRTTADAGAVLTCEVTPSNSAGSGTAVTTAGVTCPAITTLPTGTLIDTDFRGAFALDYADELASVVSSNADLIHAPVAYPVALDENYGSMFWDKTGGSPQGYFDLSRAAETTTTYDITGQIAADGALISDRADVVFTIEEIGGAVLFTETIPGADVAAAPDFHLLRDFSGTLTTGSITDLRVKMIWGSGTGGTGGMDMHLTQLSIVAQ